MMTMFWQDSYDIRTVATVVAAAFLMVVAAGGATGCSGGSGDEDTGEERRGGLGDSDGEGPQVWPGSEELAWTFDPGEESLTPPARTADGTVVTAGWSGSVYAVDAQGNVVWEHDVGSTIDGAPTIGAGTVYLGTYDGEIVALDAASGDEQWRFEADGIVDKGLALGGDGTLYAVTQGSTLVAVDGEGDEKWSFELSDEPVTAPSVLDDGESPRIFVGTNDDKLHCISTADEVSAQSADLEGQPSLAVLPDASGAAYVSTSNGRVNGVSAECDVQWQQYPSWAGWTGAVWGEDGSLVFGLLDRSLNRFSPEGDKKWSGKTTVHASPAGAPLALEGGTFVVSTRGLVEFDANGEVDRLSVFDFLGAPVLVDDGKGLVDANERGQLVRYDFEEARSAASVPWYAHHADFERTNTLSVE